MNFSASDDFQLLTLWKRLYKTKTEAFCMDCLHKHLKNHSKYILDNDFRNDKTNIICVRVQYSKLFVLGEIIVLSFTSHNNRFLNYKDGNYYRT